MRSFIARNRHWCVNMSVMCDGDFFTWLAATWHTTHWFIYFRSTSVSRSTQSGIINRCRASAQSCTWSTSSPSNSHRSVWRGRGMRTIDVWKGPWAKIKSMPWNEHTELNCSCVEPVNNEAVYLMTGVDCVLWVAVDKRVAAGQQRLWVCVCPVFLVCRWTS